MTPMSMRTNKKIMLGVAGILCIAVIGALCINVYVKNVCGKYILLSEDAVNKDAECIVVLGCGVKSDGTPSDMLEDRLIRGIELYKAGAASKLLMSGDHGSDEYDEVGAMKRYAIEAGVPAEDIFMDHAGFSTYESIYRAKEIFGVKKLIIVTQEYHLYRALYIAQSLGMEAYGVASDYRTYAGQSMRDVRELLARCKDFFISILRPKPTYMGDEIPINGNGNVTNNA